MLVTITGPPGAGTTTVCKMLEKKLGVPHVYAGQIFREAANARGMSLEEFSRYAEQHHEVDKELDGRLVEVARTGKVVLEGRLAGWMAFRTKLPSYRVYIRADDKVRAERVAHRDRIAVSQALQLNKAREESEAKRYREIYGIDIADMGVYDLVLDSTNMPAAKIAARVEREAKRRFKPQG
ncbi:MAG: (d)CMP kinase [Methanobacteriota archaeon]